MAVSRRWFSVAAATPTVRRRLVSRVRATSRMASHPPAHTSFVAGGTASPTSTTTKAPSTNITPAWITNVCPISTLA